MGRLDSLVGPMGLVILAVFVLAALLLGGARYMGARGRRGGGSSDPDGLDDVGDGDGPDAGPPEYEDFGTALRSYVLPIREAHPGWERLDGAVGIPGRAAFRFRRDGIRFEVNGETVFAPLLAAQAWMEARPGEDPLEVHSTGRVGRLRLRRDIWRDPRDVRITTN